MKTIRLFGCKLVKMLLILTLTSVYSTLPASDDQAGSVDIKKSPARNMNG
jgi:hypothetical protein